MFHGGVYERGDKNYIYIIGQTKTEDIVYNFTNRLVAKYKWKTFTDEEVQDESLD